MRDFLGFGETLMDHADPRGGSTGSRDLYARHRAMRERLRAAQRQGRLAVLDIGSFKICCAIIEFDGDIASPRVLGVAQLRSRGVRAGVVVDMAEAEQAIRQVVAQTERAAGVRVYHALATLTGGFPRSQTAAAEVAVSEGGRVTEADVVHALRACKIPSSGPAETAEARTTLHAQPVSWTLDGEHGLRDPKGLSGRRLGVDLHILTVAESAMRNVATALLSADLEPVGVVSTAYASALSCLMGDEQDHGAACIDLGGGASAVSLFLRGRLVFADLVRLGGEHVTLDVSRGFGFDFDAAERLKILEGSAIALGSSMRGAIGVGPSQALDSDLRGYGAPAPTHRTPSRSDLVAVIRPRIEEILELARDRLEQAGFAYLPTRRAVLCGGAAQMPGVLETAQRVLGRDVRIGRPKQFRGLAPDFAGAPFAALTGLMVYAANPPEEVWDLSRPVRPRATSLSGRMWRWIRDSW